MRDSSGNVFENGESIVNAFCQYYQSVYIYSDPEVSFDESAALSYAHNSVNLSPINESELALAFRKLRANNTCGTDMLPGFLIKDCQIVLTTQLLYLFNLILQNDTYPKCWKSARICPVFKSGDKSLVNNYRPISILNNFSKLFEHVVFNQIYPSETEHI